MLAYIGAQRVELQVLVGTFAIHAVPLNQDVDAPLVVVHGDHRVMLIERVPDIGTLEPVRQKRVRVNLGKIRDTRLKRGVRGRIVSVVLAHGRSLPTARDRSRVRASVVSVVSVAKLIGRVPQPIFPLQR